MTGPAEAFEKRFNEELWKAFNHNMDVITRMTPEAVYRICWYYWETSDWICGCSHRFMRPLRIHWKER